MRKILFTTLWIALVLALTTPTLATRAAPVAAEITLSLDASGALEQPLSRWADETAAMVRLTVTRTDSDDHTAVALSLDMGVCRAFDLLLAQESGALTLSGTLLDQPIELPALCDWAVELLSCTETLGTMPSTGRTIVLSGEGLALALDTCAIHLRAWAATARATAARACNACGQCPTCKQCELSEAAALLIDAIGGRFDPLIEQNVLLIALTPTLPPQFPPHPSTIIPAPDNATVQLIERALRDTCLAIAANPVEG